MSQTVLIVDDEENIRQGLAEILADEGFHVETASDGREALVRSAETAPDIVLTDVRMPGMDGMELLAHVRSQNDELPVIIMTAFGSVTSAVDAMKSGAADYLTKPINVEELSVVIRNTLLRKNLQQEVRLLRDRVGSEDQPKKLIGDSHEMRRVSEAIDQVAPTNVTVLILGETGTGKELVAEAIHKRSPRKEGPFIKLNCSTLSENLLESELFGHEKGAFTGASEQRRGKFEDAHKGTLFLDEVGEISGPTQVKLLRFLQEQAFERVGGNDTIHVDVRLLAATNQNLDAQIEAGDFRQDLYYRLNVITIELPPLRERKGDIPPLVQFFVDRYTRKNSKPVRWIHPSVIRALSQYNWPGNIRELENVIERSVVLAEGGVLETSHLPDQFHASEESEVIRFPGSSLKQIERYAIEKTLDHTGGNRTRTARVLGISVRKLQYKLKEYAAKDKAELGESRGGLEAALPPPGRPS
ncbi:MAG: sigma-54 dependent transcriptional regulator [Planctomycetota bacterium]|jgi:DNA-binding NtrC family response regulator|nr:sigma-54 dependent transcriptional regulator [Planctomycetota bacterium]MDP7129798.1 sigma-54 dependent transcriptional regulator [Planctomycetota bacterium]MDP7248253.1 sigma-54 dependent transcriptional regulator [Planctomycetota bacterium]